MIPVSATQSPKVMIDAHEIRSIQRAAEDIPSVIEMHIEPDLAFLEGLARAPEARDISIAQLNSISHIGKLGYHLGGSQRLSKGACRNQQARQDCDDDGSDFYSFQHLLSSTDLSGSSMAFLSTTRTCAIMTLPRLQAPFSAKMPEIVYFLR